MRRIALVLGVAFATVAAIATIGIWEPESATAKAKIVAGAAAGLCFLLIRYGSTPKGPFSLQ